MSLPAYTNYKPSGVSWMGRIPTHWQLVPFGSIARITGGATPSREVPAYWGGDVPWVTAKDMKVEEITSSDESITEAGLQSCSTHLIPVGSLLMVVRSGILKHTIPVAINRVPVSLNQDLKSLRFQEDTCDARFFLRWIQGFNDVLLQQWGKQGATVESIELGYLTRSLVALPPHAEQRRIADFLDGETATIDTLIAEQERLIALLQEKRQAVISHAVTKGLDPNVPTKDSGVEWIGLVPAHWHIDRLKRHCNLRASNVDKKSVDGQVAVKLCNYTDVYYNDVISGDIPFMEATATDAQVERLHLEAGDVIITKDSESADDIARSAFVPVRIEGVVCGYHLAILRPRSHAVGLFIKYCFDGALAKAQVAVESNGLTRVALGQYSIDNLTWAWPPREEQERIANFLQDRCRLIDTCISEARSLISLFRERRTALITAAVTGQIDVRGLVENAA